MAYCTDVVLIHPALDQNFSYRQEVFMSTVPILENSPCPIWTTKKMHEPQDLATFSVSGSRPITIKHLAFLFHCVYLSYTISAPLPSPPRVPSRPATIMQSYCIPQLQRQPKSGSTEKQPNESTDIRPAEWRSENPLLDEIRSYPRIVVDCGIHGNSSSSINPEDHTLSYCHNAVMPIRRQSFDESEHDDVTDDVTDHSPYDTKDNSPCNAALPQRRDSFRDIDECDVNMASTRQQSSPLAMDSHRASSTTSGTVTFSPRTRMAQENALFRAKLLCNALNDMGLFDEDEGEDRDEGKLLVMRLHTKKSREPFSRYPPSA